MPAITTRSLGAARFSDAVAHPAAKTGEAAAAATPFMKFLREI